MAEIAAPKKEKREQAPALQIQLTTTISISKSIGGVKEIVGSDGGCTVHGKDWFEAIMPGNHAVDCRKQTRAV
jgi:hypothetical protein